MTRRRKLCCAVVASVFALLGWGCGRESDATDSSGETENNAERTLAEERLGPVSARVLTTATTVRFGDRMPVTIAVDAPSSVELTALVFSERLGHFRIRGQSRTRKQGSETRYSLNLEPERSGKNIGAIPPITFKIKEGEGAGSERALLLPSFEIDVLALDSSEVPTVAALATPFPLVALQPLKSAEQRWWWVIAAGAVLVLASGLWLFRHRRQTYRASPPLDPAEEARRALERLLASDLRANRRFGDFYVGLTGIVRVFIERTTNVHAPEQTTEEFLRTIRGSDIFPPERKRSLGEFLEAADLVKYAAQVPGDGDIDEAVAAARSFCGLATPGRVHA